jgi:RNA polymerase sigma-70 factor, ECF subfamily
VAIQREACLDEFGSNVERHRRELLVHCYRMLGSLPDAEDAVQETLLRAWRYRDSVKEGAPLRPWLYRVATNACLESIFVVWFQASSETFQ